MQDNATLRILPPAESHRFFIGSAPNQKGVANVTNGATLEFVPDGTDAFRTFIGFTDDGVAGAAGPGRAMPGL